MSCRQSGEHYQKPLIGENYIVYTLFQKGKVKCKTFFK